jgi:hypothetical protein
MDYKLKVINEMHKKLFTEIHDRNTPNNPLPIIMKNRVWDEDQNLAYKTKNGLKTR